MKPKVVDKAERQKDSDLEARFNDLAARWRAEVAHISSTMARLNHPAYQQIIELGPNVVPLLLRELEWRPNHWFAALKALTGVDPVSPSDQGKIGLMAEAWIRWGREHGYRVAGGPP
jgi:hypothetical protein